MSLQMRLPSIPWNKLTHTEKPPKEVMPDPNGLLEILKEYQPEYKHTPDAHKLELKELQPVFVYCEYMKGGLCYDNVKDILALDDRDKTLDITGYTEEAYEVWQTKDGRYSTPVALSSKSSPIWSSVLTFSIFPTPAKVKGKLVFVKSEHMNILDKAKQQGVLFRRKKIRVHWIEHTRYEDKYNTPFVVRELKCIEAWCYLGKHKHWNTILDGGFSFTKGNMIPHCPPQIQGPVYFFRANKVARGKL